MVTVQEEPVPLHAPPQPAKLQPETGAALRVTGAPAGYEFAHVPGQLITWSVLVTVPLPLVDTVNGKVCWVKVAVADMFWVMVMLHDPVPLQAPFQPEKFHPDACVALSVIGALAE